MESPNKPPAKAEALRVGFISLGCAKNLVDSEIMLGALLAEGAEITNDVAAADVVIVNTCSFIEAAQQESVDAILETAVARRDQRADQGLVVAGCLPQRFREQLPRLLPEVDAFMGIDEVAQVGSIVREALQRRRARAHTHSPASRPPAPKRGRSRALVQAFERHAPDPAESGDSPRNHASVPMPGPAPAPAPALAAPPSVYVRARPTYIPDYATPRFRLTPAHFAYVKIAEGCNHPCSFCTIPRMRGGHRSRPQSDVVAEARALIASGIKELNLISQDTTFYGLDLRSGSRRPLASPARFGAEVASLPADHTTLCTLLRELNALPGEFWIRLLYTHPAHWTDELILTLAQCEKVARYVDMPLQHIHDDMLERMRRETSRAHIESVLQRLRAGVPGIAVRTTFIVGFPGESDAHFDALLDFIRHARFERLGVFTYSKEEGTRAAAMERQVPERLKRRRRELAMVAQRDVVRRLNAQAVGRTFDVLAERTLGVRQAAEVQADSWEHGTLREKGTAAPRRRAGLWTLARSHADAPDIDGRVYVRGKLPLGGFVRVRVAGYTDYDLIAEPV
jgi:ribosomal protein S12 methylthiotransferase